MPWFTADLFDWTLYDGAGTAVGLVLILLQLLLLPGAARRKVRWPALFLAAHVVLLALRLPFPLNSTPRDFFRFGGEFLLFAAVGQSLFLLLTQSVLSRVFLQAPPQIFLDVAHGLVYIGAFVVTLSAAGVRPGELFAGSALLTAVLGLSLRDTLGNLMAGLALQAQRPFEVGDWIQFGQDANQLGRVTEINWRAIRVLTPDHSEIVVPNALLALTPIVNFSRPGGKTRRTVYVHAPEDAPPRRVLRVFRAALTDAPFVLADPAPSVTTNAFDERGVQYRVRFFIADFGDRFQADSEVRNRLWYALRRHGLAVPPPARALRLSRAREPSAARQERGRVERQEQALRHVDIFAGLPDAARARLAGLARARLYDDGEVIVRQGDRGAELFLVESGEVTVTVSRPGEKSAEVARLGRHQFFGEMSLLTGEPCSATVRAVGECTVLAVDKEAFAQVLGDAPELAERVAQTIDRRRTELNSVHGERDTSRTLSVGPGHSVLERIRKFFSI